MKKRFMLSVAALSLVSAVGTVVFSADSAMKSAPAMKADDPLKVAPDMYKLDFENDNVRVMEVTFKPGQKIAKHTHPSPQSVYVLEPGQLTISHADGTSSVSDLKQGQVMWIPAETHWAQNTGTTEVKLIVSEVKDKATTATK